MADMIDNAVTMLHPPHGGKIAALLQKGAGEEGIVWLSGYGSTMEGEKATAIAAWAQENKIPLIRFDYQGCGRSSGEFLEASFGLWRRDAEFMFDTQSSGAQVLVGSSMGAWLALHLARRWPERVKALLLIAPAPDFTHRMILRNLTPAQLEEVFTKDRLQLPGEMPLSRNFIAEAREHLLLGEVMHFPFPIHILHGLGDETVTTAHVLTLTRYLFSPALRVEFIATDHRFSGDAARRLILTRIAGLLASAE